MSAVYVLVSLDCVSTTASLLFVIFVTGQLSTIDDRYLALHLKWHPALQTSQINLSVQLSTANSALFQRTYTGSQQPWQLRDGCLLIEISWLLIDPT